MNVGRHANEHGYMVYSKDKMMHIDTNIHFGIHCIYNICVCVVLNHWSLV